MKANGFLNRVRTNERAEVGIGTLIVFIAAVLVAAVAAAVLINTSGQVQERGQQTGREATQEVASNLQLFQITASRNSNTGDMLYLNITVGTAAGSFPIDLSNTTIILRSNTTLKELAYINGAATANGKFNATDVRDANDSFTTANPTLDSNDLARVMINLASTANNMPLAQGDHLDIKIVPPVGATLLANIEMPSSFGTDTMIVVR